MREGKLSKLCCSIPHCSLSCNLKNVLIEQVQHNAYMFRLRVGLDARKSDFGSLVCDDFLCFVTFPLCVLGQVWYLIVSIPDLCLLTYFVACKNQRCRSACASAQADQPLCYSLSGKKTCPTSSLQNVNILAGLCS